MFVTNRLDWGHLVQADTFDTSHLNNELYEIESNRWDWEKRYLHVNYSQSLDTNIAVAMVRPRPRVLGFLFDFSLNFDSISHTQPCPDVFWFPILTERFCDELVAEMEHFGQWSDGSNSVRCSSFVFFSLSLYLNASLAIT